MSGFYELLEKVKEKPGMYIGMASLERLYFFLLGYEFSREESGIEPTNKELKFYEEFQPWLQRRFEIKTVNSWDKIIRFFTRDDREAFDLFFKLLDEFLMQNRELDIPEAELGSREQFG